MRLLSSPRLALLLLTSLATYSGIATWLPWVNDSTLSPPTWASHVGLDHPFTSLLFLLLVVLLFLSTAACTLLRLKSNWLQFKGQLPRRETLDLSLSVDQIEETLGSQGYRKQGTAFFRNRFALLGSSVLHIGILVVLTGIAIQQGFQDSGTFQLAEGEIIRIDNPGSLLERTRGYFAPATPPALEIALESFDPFHREQGYAPDRLSKLLIRNRDSGMETRAAIDRAHGYKAGTTHIYQAIPTGFVLQVEIAGREMRALHLRGISDRSVSGEYRAPGGKQVRLILESDEPLSNPHGTGEMRVRIESQLQSGLLQKGVPFLFGTEPARIVGILRWAGFTYSHSAGIGIVFSGFALVLIGCLLLVFPAGVVVPELRTDTMSLLIFQNRGAQELMARLIETAGREYERKNR